MKPLSGEEQKAALGHIYRKPPQIDLLTGEASVKKPTAGRGSHVRLKSSGTEPVAAVGMAHFPGTGPKKKYCSDCLHFQDLEVKRGKYWREERDACAKVKELTGVVQRGGIGANRSCKYFAPK